MANREKFAEKLLPLLQHWSDVLNRGKLAASETGLEYARQVFGELQCQSLEDYHNLYLKCDSLLLACVF